MKKKLSLMVTAISAALFLGACSGTGAGGTADAAGPAQKVVFADAGWDSIRFHNAVAAYIAETAYGLEAEEIAGTTPITFNGLKGGDITAYMEVWTDNIATYNEDLEEGAIIELSVNFDDNMQGLYVPRYVIEGDAERNIEPSAPGLRSVEDLKNYSGVFVDPDDTSKGRIYGAISGWGVDSVMRNKYKYYGLDEFYNYMDPGSDAALAAAFASSYEKGAPIVGYYWEPTWLTGKYDLVLLTDAPYEESLYGEGKCACPSVRVTVCVNPDFAEAAPEFCEFLSNYKTSSKMTAEALSYIQDTNASYEDTARWFLIEHDELISEWLPADKAELVRAGLGA